MCREENIAYFLGRDVYDFIISIFETFITKFRVELQASSDKKINLENCTIFLLMTKIISKIFKKQFLDNREKLQNAFRTQQAIFVELDKYFMNEMILLLKDCN